MNPRQRRGVLLMLAAAVAAVAVFFAVAGFVADVNSQVGPRTTQLQLARDAAAYEVITADLVREVEVPERYVSPNAVASLSEVEGRRVAINLTEGAPLTDDLLVPPSDLSPTEREIAINVDPVTGIAGRARPGDFVDIYAVFADVEGLAPQVRVLVRNVRVVTVGGLQTIDRDTGEDRERAGVVPVTLALEPDDALAVTFAGNFAREVRLVGLPQGDTQDRSDEEDTYDVQDLGGKPIPVEGNQ